MRLKNFTILLVEPKKNDWLGRIVAEFTNGKYSHSAIYMNGNVYESAITISQYLEIKDGVFINNSLQKKGNIDLFEYTGVITDEQINNAYEYLSNNIGRRYNIGLLMCMVFIYPFRKWFKKHPNMIPFKNTFYGFICSELVDTAFMSAGIDLFPDSESYLITPSDLAKSSKLKKVN